MDAGDYTYETLEKVKCGSKVELRRIEQEWVHRMGAVGAQLGAGSAEKRQHSSNN
jgi:hypothetical protein